MISAATLSNRKPVVFIVGLDASLIDPVEAGLAQQGGRLVLCETHTDFFRDETPFELACVLAQARHTAADANLLRAGPASREHLPVIYLTQNIDMDHSVVLFQRGASDILTLPVRLERLTGAVDEGWRQHAALRRTRAEQLGLRARLQTLTAREHEVLLLLLDGFANKEIGDRLQIRERTVKAHRKCLMSKMGLQSLVELARRMERTELNSDARLLFLVRDPIARGFSPGHQPAALAR